MSELITFVSEAVALRGRVYRGAGAGQRPAIVMAHGFAGVASQLHRLATDFSSAGFTVLAFDHAGFGWSEGFPRQEVDPTRQIRGYRDAISAVRSLTNVRADRIGLWGTSYSGGHVMQVGALDRRVACVVAQAPFVDGWRIATSRPDAEDFGRALLAEREARSAGQLPTLIPIFSTRADERCAFPGADAYNWGVRSKTPEWRNEVTLSSFEYVASYQPGQWADRIAPRALMIIAASEDDLTPTDDAHAAFDKAAEPKRLVRVSCNHFDIYFDAAYEQAKAAALDWFALHLA